MLVLALSTHYGYTQKTGNPGSFAKTITAGDLKKHLYIIASEEMAGRETGMPGERKAAEYIENEFRRIGLKPGNNGSFHMYFNVYQDTITDAGLLVNGQSFRQDVDFNASTGNYAATMRFNEVVFLGSRTIDSIQGMNLAGRLIMLSPAVPMGRGPGSIMRTLNNKGVAGIIIISDDFPRKEPLNRKSNLSLSAYKRTVSPHQFMISEKVARAILSDDFENVMKNETLVKTFSADILVEVKKETISLQTSNVIGILPGTDLAGEFLFITAHHDHIGQRGSVINYGADDDGSGTVSIIEIAEAFAKAKEKGNSPRRTIVFMTVSGEEKGLWGSGIYTSNPIFPLDKTTADLNIDMIGRIDPKRKYGDSMNYVYVVGDDKLSSDLRTISESVNKKYTKLELDYKYNDPKDPMRIYFRSDHYNFAKNGVPIIFYFNGTHADYHRPTDTPDKINYSLLEKRAQLVFYTAWEMANRNEMLKRDLKLEIPER